MAAQPESVPTPDPVEDLIRRGALREVIELCVRRHGPAVGRLCMALLGSQAEAEEIAQDTFITAYDALPSWRGDGALRAWLFGIARRLCARVLERRAVHERRLRLVHDAKEDATAADVLVDAGRRARRARQALERLRPSERETLLLRYQAGLSFREIGIACGLDEATARKRASRALDRLRRDLETEDDR